MSDMFTPSTTLPNFFIVGAQKSGTTSLHHYLGQHPDVFMSKVKEPHFFAHMARKGEPLPSSVLFSSKLVYTWEAYAKLFEGANGVSAVGESSTGYLTSHQAPVEIRRYIPHARIIAILRHPVDRAYSNFLMNRVHGIEPLARFEDALAAEPSRRAEGWPAGKHDYVGLGLYGAALARYYAAFPREQIAVYRYEHLRDNAEDLVTEVLGFLSVDPSHRVDSSARLLVAQTPPRSAYLDRLARGESHALSAVGSFLPSRARAGLASRLRQINRTPARLPDRRRRRLINVFSEDLRRLDELTGQPFSSWLDD